MSVATNEPEVSHSDPPLSAEPTRALLENRERFLQFVARRIGSTALAEDVLQDAFAKALADGGQIRKDERVVAWFYRILRNSIIDLGRGKGAAHRALELYAGELQTTAG